MHKDYKFRRTEGKAMMTDSEICREYRLAKDKDKQIGIIADQCVCLRMR